jgi:nitrogen-specific signal transduction histidine kinase
MVFSLAPTKPTAKDLAFSISMGIINKHEGRLYLNEAAPHTRFCLELPRLG